MNFFRRIRKKPNLTAQFRKVFNYKAYELAGRITRLINYSSEIIFLEYESQSSHLILDYEQSKSMALDWKNHFVEFSDAIGFVFIVKGKSAWDPSDYQNVSGKRFDDGLWKYSYKRKRRVIVKRIHKGMFFSSQIQENPIKQLVPVLKYDKLIRLAVPFFYLVIKIKSIEENYPFGLNRFVSDYCINCYNKDILTKSFMSNWERDQFALEVLNKTNMIKKIDYIKGDEKMFDGVEKISNKYYYNVKWLKALSTPDGNYVEYVQNKK